ncbi:hypothetical protein WJX75_001725 [Coccomyxa subellipsoidea]|uniref:Helicase-associated domain-containing protein n=1 Tax=Coccomyxa subellipsoidea TaxID=248742 RepID=A0ABR2YFX8_9CHLO
MGAELSSNDSIEVQLLKHTRSVHRPFATRNRNQKTSRPPKAQARSTDQRMIRRDKYTTFTNTSGEVLRPIAENVWAADRPFIWNRIDVGGRMAVLRLSDSSIWVHSPVHLDDDLAAALATLGDVKHIVSPNYEHTKYAQQWIERYPGAWSYACPGLKEKSPEVPYTTELGSGGGDPPEWLGEVQATWLNYERNPFNGKAFFNEVVFLFKPAKLLVTSDLFWNYPSQAPGGTKLWKFGMDRVYLPFYRNLMIKDKGGYDEAMRRIFEETIRRKLASAACSATNRVNEELLDKFWLARGVTDCQQRQKLIETAFIELGADESTSAASSSTFTLPGAGAAWLLDSTNTIQQVRRVSARLLKLQSLFGDNIAVDIASMLIREPRLVTAEISHIARRLLEMRLSIGLDGTDVMAVVQAQPSLLVQESSTNDIQESDEARRRAWEFGLASDGDGEWLRRADELRDYVAAHGDAHVGFREHDDAELARWAAKQRKDWKGGDLAPDRQKILDELRFESDGERAEWMRWYGELQISSDDTMVATGRGADFYLYNWCSVQRIARRSGVLSEERIALLDSLDFDWTGADALS